MNYKKEFKKINYVLLGFLDSISERPISNIIDIAQRIARDTKQCLKKDGRLLKIPILIYISIKFVFIAKHNNYLSVSKKLDS